MVDKTPKRPPKKEEKKKKPFPFKDVSIKKPRKKLKK
jgi:hypothetical protein